VATLVKPLQAILSTLAITGYFAEMDAILDVIDAALKRKGLTDSAASKLAVGHPSLLKNLRMPRDGEKRYNLPSLMRLAEVLELEFYFGPKRSPDPATDIMANHGPEDDAPSGFLTIPWVDAITRRGTAPVAFSRSWLGDHELLPDFLLVALPDTVELEGPAVQDTLALLDTRSALRKGHGVWCFRSAGRVRVANVTFAGSVTVIHSVHSAHEPEIIEGPPGGALSVLGKVVWLGQSVPLKGKVG
jgi:hypothetical protein